MALSLVLLTSVTSITSITFIGFSVRDPVGPLEVKQVNYILEELLVVVGISLFVQIHFNLDTNTPELVTIIQNQKMLLVSY